MHIHDWKKTHTKRGEQSQKRGEALEKELLQQAELIEDVELKKIQEPVRKYRLIATEDGKGKRWTYVAEAGTHHIDFEGRLQGGILASFEAKACANPKHWNIDEKLHPVTGTQLAILKRWATMGFACFVFVRWDRGGPFLDIDHVIPVGPDGFPFGALTQIQWPELERWSLPPRKTWVDCVKAWEAYTAQGRGALL